MRKDTALTFGDIHGSVEALLESVEEIEKLALVEVEEKPLRTRFLKIPHEQPENDIFTLELIDLIEPGSDLEWVSVSYCWAQPEPQECQRIPEYQILYGGSNKQSRYPKYPIMVLHRAIRFAQSRNCQYVWIDQECINQSEPSDIEHHLQIMHRIYAESRWTVGVLSCEIPTQRLLDSLLDIVSLKPGLSRDGKGPEMRVIQYVRGDP
ncbi:hypothetical protein BU23DRAFT_654685 [Bimuria novae-zelandiae CBS 107.79]|uniref:Heterokaryon incompatibility domain-containing protein n=1 Tax=Bimuria novae-zelandiae CBS 107.79 TaxID=1447943 RepID=A0A6A5VLS5_9PLEO|nr:hypothetical protein BU23DRAFT_654685 [Bimuria novae-zelandiae CBS 107.79]